MTAGVTSREETSNQELWGSAKGKLGVGQPSRAQWWVIPVVVFRRQDVVEQGFGVAPEKKNHLEPEHARVEMEPS